MSRNHLQAISLVSRSLLTSIFMKLLSCSFGGKKNIIANAPPGGYEVFLFSLEGFFKSKKKVRKNLRNLFL